MLGLLNQSFEVFLYFIFSLLAAITVHEFAHAWAAVKLGDPTPKIQKRLTLNPIAHLDPLGTLLLFLVGFGWGKPVMFDPFNLENPRRDAALISLAGPVSNLISATLMSILFWLSTNAIIPFPISLDFVFVFIRLNIILAVFNLIPIHPLDGGKILVGLLPARDAAQADRFMKQYGIFLLLILIFPIFGSSPVLSILSPIINALMNVYLPGVHIV